MPLQDDAGSLESMIKEIDQGITSLLHMVDRGISGKPLETPRTEEVTPARRKGDPARRETSASNSASTALRREQRRRAQARPASSTTATTPATNGTDSLWVRLHHEHTGTQGRPVQHHTPTTQSPHPRSDLRSESLRLHVAKKKSMSPSAVKRRSTTTSGVQKTAPRPIPERAATTTVVKPARSGGVLFSKGKRSVSAERGERPGVRGTRPASSITPTVPVRARPAQYSVASYDFHKKPSAAPTLSPASRSLSHPIHIGGVSPPLLAVPAFTLGNGDANTEAEETTTSLPQKTATAPPMIGAEEEEEKEVVVEVEKVVEVVEEKVEEKVEAPVPKKFVLPKLSLQTVMDKKKTDASFTYESFLTQVTGEEDIRAAHDLDMAQFGVKEKEKEKEVEVAEKEEEKTSTPSTPTNTVTTLEDTMVTNASLGNSNIALSPLEETQKEEGDAPPPSYEAATAPQASAPAPQAQAPQAPVVPSKPRIVLPKLALGGVLEKKQADPSFTYEKYLTQVTGEEDIRAEHEVLM